ncbi:ribonuclease H-like protein, partial [Irpex lacteus]
DTTVVYTDGSCLNNGSLNSTAGAGIWFGKEDKRNIAIRVQDNLQSNNTGELTAILYVLQSTPKIIPLKIKSDSSYAINGIIWNSRKWEEKGWIGVDNKDLFKAILSWNRARGAKTEYKWIKGHSKEEGPDKEGNDAADELARQGTDLPRAKGHVHTTLEDYLPTGAQISKTTQKILYQGIRMTKYVDPRRKTVTNLSLIQDAILKETSLKPTEERIWTAIRNRVNSRKIQIFLWKLIHDAFRCGNWWKNLNSYEERATCQICNEEDSMEHILLKCKAPGQGKIWNLAKARYEKKTNIKLEITKGTIMGANLLSFKDKDGKKLVGASRLATIIITESAFVIWKVRCERVIVEDGEPQKTIPEIAIENKWLNALNTRLKTDIALTNKRFPKHKQVKDELVLKTWSGTLDREHLLPKDWISWTGVLVGRLTKDP